MKNKFKQDKGQAGLNILLSVVVMLFIIGLIITIFALMGGELRDATLTPDVSVVVVNETALPITAGVTLAGGLLTDGTCGTVTLRNATGVVTSLAGNFTQVNCVLTNTTSEFTTYGTPYASYTYTYSQDNTVTDVMNSTVNGIAGASDWFDIFLVITAMIVLILLTVIIITAIRSSGMIGGNAMDSQIGTA